jgi:hypothetical protein
MSNTNMIPIDIVVTHGNRIKKILGVKDVENGQVFKLRRNKSLDPTTKKMYMTLLTPQIK